VIEVSINETSSTDSREGWREVGGGIGGVDAVDKWASGFTCSDNAKDDGESDEVGLRRG
jgi:hypothetical protein